MLAAFATALLVTALTVPAVLATLRRFRVFDTPSDRSSHDVPTPRGGGIAVGVAALAGLGIALSGVWSDRGEAGGLEVDGAAVALVVACAGFGLIGLIDDLRRLSPFVRLLAQAAVASVAVPFLMESFDSGAAVTIAFGVATALWLVGFVNGFNFMDGINGISAAQVIVAGATFWALGSTEGLPLLEAAGAIVVGAAVGFLPYNFPHASIFLGDVGSYFLGAWLAVLAVAGFRAGLPPESVAFPLALYVADTAATIVRRIKRREVWYTAHRDHAYQRLVRAGWSHTRTTMLVFVLLGVLSLLGAVSLGSSNSLRVVADVTAGAVLLAYLSWPRLATRHRALLAA